ncbi:Uncharacterised protein [Enterobacter asburiae]|uniref:Uncharacterized protein n=1 Tax=Enterobacter asburiae TaxID=61645 RepID=A0A376FHX4_ENTAS|nr:Uncharacterised protein [Enterobacter asburiae]
MFGHSSVSITITSFGRTVLRKRFMGAGQIVRQIDVLHRLYRKRITRAPEPVGVIVVTVIGSEG